ncbi:hypothetical protein [Streptomyces luteogriseus]|uniref:hypothetical protein n=1 Tax=Streptomyces luteogriseus TaxID=68233 RepID=UPI00381496C3
MTDQNAMDRGARAEALLLRFTVEAHRRKWDYDRGLDDDGQPIKSEAFDALHRLGEEMRVELEKLRAAPPVQAPADRAALRDRIAEALADADGWKWAPGFKGESPTWHGYQARADAVLPLLPAPVDRAELDSLGREADRLRKAWVEMRDRAERIEAEVERLRTDRAAVLTPAERTMLTYALDQAQEHIWSRDGFTDEDQAAVTSLRRLVAGCPQCGDTGACNGGPCPLRPAAEAQPAEAWDVPDARPGTTDHTLTQRRAATVDPAMCPRCKGDNQEAFELCAKCAAEAQQDGAQS